MIAEGLLADPDVGGDWPLYENALPDDDSVEESLVGIFDTAGILHGRSMQGVQYQHHGFQLRFRCVDSIVGYNKAQEVIAALLLMHNELIEIGSGESYRIASFTQTSDIVPIQLDEKQRTHYTVNFVFAYSGA